MTLRSFDSTESIHDHWAGLDNQSTKNNYLDNNLSINQPKRETMGIYLLWVIKAPESPLSNSNEGEMKL